MDIWFIEKLDRLIGKLHHAGTVTATNKCNPILSVFNVCFFFFEFLSLKGADEARREGGGVGGLKSTANVFQ